MSVWEKIKTQHLLGYYTGNSATVQVLEHLALLFPAVYLGLLRGGSFSFLIRPAPPILPFNAWQVLAWVLHGASIVLNG